MTVETIEIPDHMTVDPSEWGGLLVICTRCAEGVSIDGDTMVECPEILAEVVAAHRDCRDEDGDA